MNESVVVESASSVLVERRDQGVDTNVLAAADQVLISERGVPGKNGTGSVFSVYTQTAAADGEQTFILPFLVSQYRLLSINGLIQLNSEFTITGNELHIPPELLLKTGDVLQLICSIQE